MREVDDWIRGLEGPPPTMTAPTWPEERRSSSLWAVLLLAAVALIVGVAALSLPSGPGLRGTADPATVDLRLAVERGNVAVRAVDGTTCRVGESVFFRLSATRDTEAVVWVEGPTGREPIAKVPVGPAPTDLADADGLVAYRFDAPGRYVFRASPEIGRCERCPTISVEVR